MDLLLQNQCPLLARNRADPMFAFVWVFVNIVFRSQILKAFLSSFQNLKFADSVSHWIWEFPTGLQFHVICIIYTSSGMVLELFVYMCLTFYIGTKGQIQVLFSSRKSYNNLIFQTKIIFSMSWIFSLYQVTMWNTDIHKGRTHIHIKN